MLAFAAPVVRAEEPAPPPPRSEWKLYWDDGLYYRFVQQIPVAEGPILSHVEDQLGFAGKVNARLEVDGAVYGGDTDVLNMHDDAEFRRIYLGTSGELFLLTHAWYSITFEFLDSGVELGDTYLQWRDRPWMGTITVGNFSPPFSLEGMASSRDITFMEEANPVSAFAPGRAFGVQVGKPFFEQRYTWALGAFTGAALGDPDVGDASRDIGRVAARMTWLARDNPEGEEFVHLGLSGTFVFTNGDARYQTRPESHIAPHVIDTGDIDSSRTSGLALEGAWVRGPWSVQSEGLYTVVAAKQEGKLHFTGFYLYGSWFPTGESRPYNPNTGTFSQLVPRRPFSLETGGRGALELGARYSRIDLNDKSVDGGVLGELSVDATWYLTRHFLVKAEAAVGRIHGRRDLGDSQQFRLAQMRFAVSY